MTGLVLLVAAVLLGVGQIVLVPAIVSGKGRDAGIWFLVTFIWVLLGCPLLALVPAIVAMAPSARLGLSADVATLALAFVAFVIGILPLVAAMLSSPAPGAERRPRPGWRRAGRRARARYR